VYPLQMWSLFQKKYLLIEVFSSSGNDNMKSVHAKDPHG
jgi:hypothetical protein